MSFSGGEEHREKFRVPTPALESTPRKKYKADNYYKF